jgi:hypothetical protein
MRWMPTSRGCRIAAWAATLACLLVLLASVGMWVRSYRVHDQIDLPDRMTSFNVTSVEGCVGINNTDYVLTALLSQLNADQRYLDGLREELGELRADERFAEGGGQFLGRIKPRHVTTASQPPAPSFRGWSMGYLTLVSALGTITFCSTAVLVATERRRRRLGPRRGFEVG